MQILVAVNSEPYSNHAIDQVARLAANTLAKVTILSIDPAGSDGGEQLRNERADGRLQEVTDAYRDRFLSQFSSAGDSPLKAGPGSPEARIRRGDAFREILSESRQEECDLIVVGCNGADGCVWQEGQDVPRRIASEADCSVYIAKKADAVDRVVCCLGHEEISQQSLEMISQFVTLYGARLQIVGLLERGALKSDIENKLAWLISYYSTKNIEPWVEVVETKKLDDFVANEARYALMALWMGKEALLRRIFSKAKMSRLVKTSESSVLLLR